MGESGDIDFGTRRRTQLFDQIVELFLAQGFAHLTLDEIASAMRCSKSTLYTLAGSKDDLVRAVIVQFFRRATDDVERAVAETTGARERIVAYLEAVGTTLERASDQFMADLDAFAPAQEVYEQNTRLASERVGALIGEGVENGEFRRVHASFAADLASTMMVRIQQRGVRDATGLDDASAYRELAAILTAGIRA